ncbi:hypothetical protein MVEN_00198900 [Mycena venus]|uniref:F-box domain-containing protein n=1 Tax=Mycena venus TaxID=2733690 RepID=A0A8H7DBW2_9AGAR|nr:hypothetical protein MVEN_00198900 [Mycena venus]
MVRRRKSSIEKEAVIVDAQLQILRAREADFQRILEDMQRLKDSVCSERQELEAKQRELHSERQPINWLPAELLIHVFITFTEADSDSHDPTAVYHRAPVVLSHVCSRWRSIALSTSQMWSRISVQSAAWNARPIVAFLARSGKTPLDIVFISPETITSQDEYRRADRLLTHLSHDIRRIRSIAFRSRGTAMQKLVGVLTLPDNVFSSLRVLELSLVSLEPSSLSSPSLMPTQFLGSGTSLNLTYLRLVKLPLFNIPKHFLPNLTALELGFPPKRSTAEGPNSYMLRMSQLVRFLNCTPKLQELVLANTVPYMDVYLNVENAVSGGLLRVDPVELIHLRTLDWTYPFGPDIHHFLSFFNAPALEKIFVGVEELPVPPTNVLLLRGYPATAASQLFATHRVIDLVSLRDLSLECQHEETIGSVLRKFAFPVLETLELTHVDGGRPLHAHRRDASLPIFPRLESMFRDPRLPRLTHLTICRFQISAELGKTEAMLGYIPALVSLTLDGCAGVWKLLDGLQQRAAATVMSLGGGGPRPSVRVCPRLEALALLRCPDVEISSLVGIVITRNGSSGGTEDLALGMAASGPASDNGGGDGGAAANGPPVRAIRPLKKLRRQGGQGRGAGDDPGPSASPSTNILSSMIVMEEASRPARISYVRVGDCARISEEEAMTLKALGVTDVVWTGGRPSSDVDY